MEPCWMLASQVTTKVSPRSCAARLELLLEHRQTPTKHSRRRRSLSEHTGYAKVYVVLQLLTAFRTPSDSQVTRLLLRKLRGLFSISGVKQRTQVPLSVMLQLQRRSISFAMNPCELVSAERHKKDLTLLGSRLASSR